MLAVSCDDIETNLDVPNLNDPDLATIASDAASLEAVAKGLYQSWYVSVNKLNGPGMALQTMADISTCSWGNAGMKDLSSEPRVAFNNSAAYGNDVTVTYFNALYKIFSDSNLLLFAIENQSAELSNPDQIELAGKMGQALSVGYLALVFDRTWIVGPEGLSGDKIEVNHTDAMAFALDALDEAIAIADTGVGLPNDAIAGADVSGASISKLLNSLAARMLAGNARNSMEKDATDWDRVKNYATNGVTSDFTISMNGKPWEGATWYNETKIYLNYSGWGRVDMRIINMLDPNTINYWEDSTSDPLPESSSVDARLASDYQYLNSNNFKPERGLYHFSSYRNTRADNYINNWFVDIVEFSKAENDMYLAEALINQNDFSGAATIVNAGTRISRGNLSPTTTNETDVKNAVFYEKMVEISLNVTGVGFFEMRKNNLLQSGTLLHFPVPGKALSTIPENLYTYGGSTGTAGQDYSNGGWNN